MNPNGNTKYLKQFDENDTALIGTNVSNDEPIAAGGVTSLQSVSCTDRQIVLFSNNKNTQTKLQR